MFEPAGAPEDTNRSRCLLAPLGMPSLAPAPSFERRWDPKENGYHGAPTSGPFTVAEFVEEYGGTLTTGSGVKQWRLSKPELRWDGDDGPFAVAEFVKEYGGTLVCGPGVDRWRSAQPDRKWDGKGREGGLLHVG